MAAFQRYRRKLSHQNGSQQKLEWYMPNPFQVIHTQCTMNLDGYKKQPVRVGLYDIEKVIGKGNFAIVKTAKHRMTKSRVAIKIIDKSRLDESNLKKVYREVQIMKMLKHPHILKLFQVMETDNMLYIVTEYAVKGEMFAYVDKNGKLSEPDARRVFWQIISAVEYCHKRHVVHRDLKTENLLLDENLNVKIADFGFSNYTKENELLKTWCGSPPYAAPEIFEGKEYDGPAIDIWSLGVVLYVLVCAALPFDGETVHEVRDRVLEGRFRVPYFMSTELEDLLKKILVKNPAHRFTLDQIKSHDWLQEYPEDRPPLYTDTYDYTMDGEINQRAMQVMSNLGIDIKKTERSIANNAYDHLTSIYYLLCERFRPNRTSCPEENNVSTKVRRASCMADQIIVKNKQVQNIVGHKQRKMPVTFNHALPHSNSQATLQYALNELHLGDVKVPTELTKTNVPGCIKEFKPSLSIPPRLTHYRSPGHSQSNIHTVNEEEDSVPMPLTMPVRNQRRGRRSAVEAMTQNIRRQSCQPPDDETLYVPANHPLLKQETPPEDLPPGYQPSNLKIKVIEPTVPMTNSANATSVINHTSASMIIKPEMPIVPLSPNNPSHFAFIEGRRASDGVNAPFRHLLHKTDPFDQNNVYLQEFEELKILQRNVTPERIEEEKYQQSHDYFRETSNQSPLPNFSEWRPSPLSSQNEFMNTLRFEQNQESCDSMELDSNSNLSWNAPGPCRRPLSYRKISGGVSPLPAHIRRRRTPVIGESPFNSFDMED